MASLMGSKLLFVPSLVVIRLMCGRKIITSHAKCTGLSHRLKGNQVKRYNRRQQQKVESESHGEKTSGTRMRA
jgi:hypothetical protein